MLEDGWPALEEALVEEVAAGWLALDAFEELPAPVIVTDVFGRLLVRPVDGLVLGDFDEVMLSDTVTVVCERLLVETLGWLPVDTLDEVPEAVTVTVVLERVLVEPLGWLPLDAWDEVPEAVTVTVVLERLVVEPLDVDDGLGLGVDELLALKDDKREGDELDVTVTVVRELLLDVAVDEEGREGPLEVESTELVEPCAED
ncbi:hypothetical protein KC319_g8374 [Hortaea werneckii]|nr:hypothetical protein KC352_g16702 [Hortaea werneckii]KAI7561602.1 hypothetical protein KC317_g8965 [Hortaea werneckii]KAI7661606.1 hypothetical protein KC319_g8374 [Hortaea werneckii]KAI7699842.1 hypothetical protein KC322_g8590 [Hortaea werneckii]